MQETKTKKELTTNFQLTNFTENAIYIFFCEEIFIESTTFICLW